MCPKTQLRFSKLHPTRGPCFAPGLMHALAQLHGFIGRPHGLPGHVGGQVDVGERADGADLGRWISPKLYRCDMNVPDGIILLNISLSLSPASSSRSRSSQVIQLLLNIPYDSMIHIR